MLNRKITLGVGAMAAALFLLGGPAEGTVITLNGGTVVSDTYEGDTVGNDPVADVGAWSGNGGFFFGPPKGVVTNAVSPGPAPGSTQYASVGNGAAQQLGGDVNALALGDIIKFDSMVYVPSVSSATSFPFQFIVFHGPNASAANRLLDFWRNADGTWQSAGNASFAGPASYAADTWQHWELDYTVGAASATLTIDGVSASIAASNTSVTAGSFGMVAIVGNGTTTPVYLDDVIPEPASLALMGLGGLALLSRRKR